MMMPYLSMSETQAARFREETLADQNRLDPRLVEAGPYKGRYVLPERVIFDEAHEAHRDAFRMLTVITLDPELAWPPEEDTGAE